MKAITTSNTNAMVAHLWAQGEKERARSSNGNFSFAGASLYSYSTEIARIVRSPVTGERVALLTSRRYSVTTSVKHMPPARSAVRHLPTFYVSGVGGWSAIDYTVELDRMVSDYYAEVKRQKRANSLRVDCLEYSEGNICAFARLFGLTVPAIDRAADIEAIQNAHATRSTPKALAKRERERAKRKERANRAEEERVTRWRNGERVTLTNVLGVMLRVRGDTLETSMGARVPLADAIKVFRFAATVRAKGTDWRPNGLLRGPAIGDFTLAAVQADGTIIAGCHKIAWAESERLARELGITV